MLIYNVYNNLACSWNQNLSLHTKFHRNRMIPGWDLAIKPFSKWRPSAILNFNNLVFWSCDLCLNVILLLHTKLRVNRTINRGYIAKRRFSIWRPSAVRHFEFVIFWYFVTWPTLKPKSAAAHQISLKSDDPRLRYSDETIFKMAAVRHLEFSKIAILVTWHVPEHDCASTYQISC